MASKIQRNLFGEIGNWNLNVELTFRIGILRNFLSRTWWTSHICGIFLDEFKFRIYESPDAGGPEVVNEEDFLCFLHFVLAPVGINQN